MAALKELQSRTSSSATHRWTLVRAAYQPQSGSKEWSCPIDEARSIEASPARAAVGTDVLGTPSNERLIQWAAASPPPQHWLDGDEEDLF